MTIKDLKFIPEFFDRYIHLVDENTDLITGLIQTSDILDRMKVDLLTYQDYRYAPEKWTPKDILQHLIDNERIQSYRVLAFARNEQFSLPGYDENAYAENTTAGQRSIEDLLDEFRFVRVSTISLFKSLSPEQMHREGTCFNVKVTCLALGFQMIGHVDHHIKVLNERYFNS